MAYADTQADGKDGSCGRQKGPSGRGFAPNEDLPPEYWHALLEDPRAEVASPGTGASGRLLQLRQMPQHLLRVGRRCGRTVEIQKADATRLYGPEAIWSDVGQRLLDNTCGNRTRRHEEDGCWPSIDVP
ncbi:MULTISPECIES: hypothetical protein [unclassified Bradyrhizobium]|uniref:hypothetical protein n=1 Tax=unclassified Bradyrhizobium TaxID=2631580 RepID=UPI003391CF03